jgi:hypothetical protein
MSSMVVTPSEEKQSSQQMKGDSMLFKATWIGGARGSGIAFINARDEQAAEAMLLEYASEIGPFTHDSATPPTEFDILHTNRAHAQKLSITIRVVELEENRVIFYDNGEHVPDDPIVDYIDDGHQV